MTTHVHGPEPQETKLASEPAKVVKLVEARTPSPPQPQARTSLVAKVWFHRWFVLAALLSIGIGGWETARLVYGPAVVVDRLTRGNLVQSVVASGHIETPYRVEIGSQITGTVEEVLVDEGQRVNKGQALVSLEASELKAAKVQADGAVAQAAARMTQLKELFLPSAREALKQSQATLLDAQRTFDRTSQLASHGYATQATLDDAQKNLDVARTQVRTAELQVYTSSPGGSDYVMAETQLNQAKANLDTAISRLSYATIVAPRDGVLITRNVERGTVVQPGRALLVLAPDGDAQLVLQVDERNLGLVKLGQRAVASADAYPDQHFSATVSYINPGIDITRATVEVKLKVAAPPEYIRQDMTVSVDIAVAQRENTLILPNRSVHDALSDDPWVIGVRRGRAYRQSVRLGIRGGTQVEIIGGLAEGDAAVPAASGIRTGQPLRAITP